MVDDIKTNDDKDAEKQFPGIKPDNDSSSNAKPNDSISLKSSNPKNTSAKNESWKDKFMSKGLELWPHTKKEKTIGIAIVGVLLVLGSITVFALNKYANKPFDISNSKITHIEKTTAPSKLTGVEVAKSLNDAPIFSVQIENSPDARPQSSLYDAGLVFEAIAEGGITRFNANFLETNPGSVGPVRSSRPYYPALVAPLDPVFVNAGGSAEGIAEIRKLKLKNIDALAPGRPFNRVGHKVAPHNLYTSLSGLKSFAKKNKMKNSDTKSFLRKKKEEPLKKPTVTKIDVSISSPLYNSHYDYDKKSNSYKRKMAGSPHVDEHSKKQIRPKVVVFMVMNYSQAGIYSVYKTTGSGSAFIFQDGGLEKVTWKRSAKKDQFKFFDSSGSEVALNPGKTWITLLGNKNEVKFAR